MDQQHTSLAVLVLLCLASGTLAIRWKDCGSVQAKPSDVIVAGCETQPTCLLHKGTNITFGVNFVPNVDNSDLKMLVYGHVAGFDVPFPIDNPDACKDSNVTCPVQKGKSYSYRNYIYVKNEYPSLSLVVKLKLVNKANDVLVCVVIPVQITSSPKNSPLRFAPKQ
jgi:Niemann-Pick C2 protein